MHMTTAGSIMRMILETASGWRRPSAPQSLGERGRKSAGRKHSRWVIATAYKASKATSLKNNKRFMRKLIGKTKSISCHHTSNFQSCHTAPAKQTCEKNSHSTYQPFTKETCQAELRGNGLINVVGAWCRPLHTAQTTCKVSSWDTQFLF